MKYISFIPLYFLAAIAAAQRSDSLPAKVYHWDSLLLKRQSHLTLRPVMEGSTTALSWFEVTALTLDPGKFNPPSAVYYDVEELIIVKEGLVGITIDGVTKQVGAGSVSFVMPRMVHSIKNTGNTKATCFLLKYKGRLPMDIDRAKRAGGAFTIDWNDLPTTNTGKGYRRDFFNRPTSQLGQFEMHSTALNANEESHAPHTHVQEEIILLLRGEVEMYIDGERYKASAGDIVFLPSRIPHALTNTGEEQCEYFAFQWRN